MRTPELERVFIDAPEPVVELREEISSFLAISSLRAHSQPGIHGTVNQYAEELGEHWGEVVTDITREEFGDDIEEIARVTLLRTSGRLIQYAARAESIEITNLVDHCPELTKRERIGRKLRNFFRKNISVNDATPAVFVECEALDYFAAELSVIERGQIQSPEDLGAVANRTAKNFIRDRLTMLDENSLI